VYPLISADRSRFVHAHLFILSEHSCRAVCKYVHRTTVIDKLDKVLMYYGAMQPKVGRMLMNSGNRSTFKFNVLDSERPCDHVRSSVLPFFLGSFSNESVPHRTDTHDDPDGSRYDRVSSSSTYFATMHIHIDPHRFTHTLKSQNTEWSIPNQTFVRFFKINFFPRIQGQSYT
jgi:hypothetical protein